jgi:hypothetical protein
MVRRERTLASHSLQCEHPPALSQKSIQIQGPIWCQRSIIVEVARIADSFRKASQSCVHGVYAVYAELAVQAQGQIHFPLPPTPSIDAGSASNTGSLLSRHSDCTWSLHRDGTWGRSYSGLSIVKLGYPRSVEQKWLTLDTSMQTCDSSLY